MTAMNQWKASLPEKGAHELGPPRWAVAAAGAVAQFLLSDPTRCQQLQKFEHYRKNTQKLSDMEGSVQLATAKETRDQQILLKLRQQLARQLEW